MKENESAKEEMETEATGIQAERSNDCTFLTNKNIGLMGSVIRNIFVGISPASDAYVMQGTVISLSADCEVSE